MAGEPLEAVEVGVYTMLSALKKNPYAIETAHLSLITFDAKARVVVPLTEVTAINPPALSIRPGTSMGAALDLVQESINKEVVKTTADNKGDYKPMVFIMTDGQPTDDWHSPAARLRSVRPHLAQIYAIGCGEEVDFETLSQIADVCIHIKSLSPESMAKLFVWLSASVQSQSASPDTALSLEKKIPLEKGMELIDSARPPKFSGQNQRLFFHVACSKTKKHYLMRYRFEQSSSLYTPESAIKLPDDFFGDGAKKTPPTGTDLLSDILDCPYCGAQALGKCGFCDHLFCVDPASARAKVVCPVCETTLSMAEDSGPFSIAGSQG
jgi:uncharacterized protein YegL